MEFLTNIYAWLQATWDAIAAILGLITTVVIIPVIKALYNQNKKLDDNTTANNTTLKENENFKQAVENNTLSNVELSEKMKDAASQASNLKSEYVELKTSFLQVNSKLTSILDIMSMAYSTIKDETIRKSISTIIDSVKYNDAAIASEVKISENNKEVKEPEATIVKEKIIEPVEKKEQATEPKVDTPTKTTAMRY
jgi:hypothetical protein